MTYAIFVSFSAGAAVRAADMPSFDAAPWEIVKHQSLVTISRLP
jgi:hypothetical protein